MLAMALRHRPQLILSYITPILEGIEGERMAAVMVYTLAVMERSPKQFMEALENIEFTTKPEAMSTLEMLKEEGRQEGSARRAPRGADYPPIEDSRQVPAAARHRISRFYRAAAGCRASLPRAAESGTPASLMQYIEEELLAGIPLQAEDRRTMEELAEQLFSQR